MKPIIGIPSDQLVEINPRMPGDYPAYAPHDVKEAIFAAGGIPIILPFPDDNSHAQEAARDAAALFNGLLLPGGPDVDPLFFGEEPIPEIGITLTAKDRFEIALIKETLAANKPIFGICRGIQILNVSLGGTLYQDLKAQYSNYAIQHSQATLGHFPTHHIRTKKQSHLQSILGDEVVVNSRHHQAVHELAPALEATAVAPDGIIEAVEGKSQNILAVQWHPENLWHNDPTEFKLFTDFVSRAQG
ncbi:gamma-glutamyl-gamma-aminobutyrate hydrolase family protein [Liquorilactobacillus oeni]|uniref:Glutamine amidotransferase n=1 Tax=Liquorilactobacillus oeni DSM 19972 TaxID=1423777 RepID=A0A0R1MKY7_9LACO|nr:gamma-glutamyl-gamma-aminobutyrate hydrolase family protein [Liquorilactobacillus oeni]KRL05251.1 glutamine amidotransferase [Liquorilactobacillus oeni DSM 19972]